MLHPNEPLNVQHSSRTGESYLLGVSQQTKDAAAVPSCVSFPHLLETVDHLCPEKIALIFLITTF